MSLSTILFGGNNMDNFLENISNEWDEKIFELMIDGELSSKPDLIDFRMLRQMKYPEWTDADDEYFPYATYFFDPYNKGEQCGYIDDLFQYWYFESEDKCLADVIIDKIYDVYKAIGYAHLEGEKVYKILKPLGDFLETKGIQFTFCNIKYKELSSFAYIEIEGTWD